MIDVDLTLTVADRQRRFHLTARFQADVPFVALYGPSGAGKSLTLQAIAGLLKPGAGHVRLDGRTLYDSAQGINLPVSQRRIGYLFQDYALFPHLSVRDNVGFGLGAWPRRRLSRDQCKVVDGLLESFGLTAMADSRPATLSGGQQQRVALARALACEPQVLLLDEPFASLNPMLRASLRQELAEVRKRWAIPVLMITHDIDDVLALADVAFIYEDGRVVREVDIRNGSSRNLGVQALTGESPVDETPVRQTVRRLLLGGRGA